jgi:hypothetical protein
MPHEHGSRNGTPTSSLFCRGCRGRKPDGGSRAETAHVTTSVEPQSWVLEDEVGAQLLTRGARGIELTPARRYVNLGFGGAHTDSNQRLMYTSA